jgi:hypothetical protein
VPRPSGILALVAGIGAVCLVTAEAWAEASADAGASEAPDAPAPTARDGATDRRGDAAVHGGCDGGLDGGLDEGRDDAGARRAETTSPTPVAPPPPARPPPSAHDAAKAAADEITRQNEARWPLSYVDRPQTMWKGMQALTLTARQYFGGPAGYRRFLVGPGVSKAITDRLEGELSFPDLYCSGRGAGACGDSLHFAASLVFAAMTGDLSKLAFGAAYVESNARVELWTRLKLVRPHRFSLELEPLVLLPLETTAGTAWWDPTVTQDTNQARAYLTFDANLQLTRSLLLWADVIPYVPLRRASEGDQIAVEAAAGASVAVSKTFEIHVSCRAFDVLPARRWEYVPDVRECALTLLARSFGPLVADEPPPTIR